MHRSPSRTDRLNLAFTVVFAFLTLLSWSAFARAGDDVPDAPDLSGTYAITGTFVDSTNYTGTLELKKKLSVKWRKGPKYNSYDAAMKYSTGWEAKGVATFIDGRLYVATAEDKKYLGLSVKRPVVLSSETLTLRREYVAAQQKNRKSRSKKLISVKGDPWWTDIWHHGHYGVMFRADGFWAIETVGRIDDGRDCPPLGAGKWTYHRMYYEDNGKPNHLDYKTGDFVVESAGEAWRASYLYWDSDKRRVGEPNVGAALMPDATTLVDVVNGSGTAAVAFFDIQGRNFVGRICETKDLVLYTQSLAIPDGVVAKNPELFH
ncbi:MAG: hypothetical protein AAB011_00710 [Candidatus Eisenbacteria bacterium]